MTPTLSPLDLTLIQCSAELDGLSHCLRMDCDDDQAPTNDPRRLLADRLKSISQRLYDAIEVE